MPQPFNETYEHSDNVGMVCSDCAPKSGSFAGHNPETFVGKYVKLGFKATHPITRRETKEHMWLKVERTDGPLLVGVLDNDPMLETDVKFGDTVNFTASEIEEVLEG